jgi:hypothetical protein
MTMVLNTQLMKLRGSEVDLLLFYRQAPRDSGVRLLHCVCCCNRRISQLEKADLPPLGGESMQTT